MTDQPLGAVCSNRISMDATIRQIYSGRIWTGKMRFLSPDQVTAIRNSREPVKALAKRFGTSTSAIRRVQKGQTYTNDAPSLIAEKGNQ